MHCLSASRANVEPTSAQFNPLNDTEIAHAIQLVPNPCALVKEFPPFAEPRPTIQLPSIPTKWRGIGTPPWASSHSWQCSWWDSVPEEHKSGYLYHHIYGRVGFVDGCGDRTVYGQVAVQSHRSAYGDQPPAVSPIPKT